MAVTESVASAGWRSIRCTRGFAPMQSQAKPLQVATSPDTRVECPEPSLLSRAGKALGQLFNVEAARFQKEVDAINALEVQAQRLQTPADFQAKTAELKARLAAGASPESLRREAYAVARQAAVVAIGKRPFDCQIMGALAMDSGHIAEMRTGEGKTLTAVLPLYLNALAGKGAHLVTVNDTLAQRDCDDMSPIFTLLGLTCATVLESMTPEQRRAGYAADVTYTTDRALGFDVLRDLTARKLESRVQREPFFALVDEVDEVLLDEARTPLIISGNSRPASPDFQLFNAIVSGLTPGQDFLVERETQSVWLTEAGSSRVDDLLRQREPNTGSLFSDSNVYRARYLMAALKAHYLLRKDIDYIVTPKGVEIVDRNKGRTSEGRRYNDGLHQALEAKEGVRIQDEQTTVASVTYPNLFKHYPRLAGMSGTAKSSEAELMDLYGLDVVTIPTNKPSRREDLPDVIFATHQEKYAAVADRAAKDFFSGKPVLVGTLSVEHNLYVAQALLKAGVPEQAIQVLNAASVRGDKAIENEIISNAGRSGVITVATNMAGRGADIKPDLINFQQLSAEMIRSATFGGAAVELSSKKEADWLCQWLAEFSPQVSHTPEGGFRVALGDGSRHLSSADFPTGGLTVYGTARGDSERIDDQLIGRAGRQGAPGTSQFFLSAEDDLMVSLSSAQRQKLIERVIDAGGSLSGSVLDKIRQKAQRTAEGKAAAVREKTQKQDRVLDDQRKEYFAFRDALLGADETSIRDEFAALVADAVKSEMLNALGHNSHPSVLEARRAAAQAASTLNLPLQLPSLAEGQPEKDKLRDLHSEIDSYARSLTLWTLSQMEKTTPDVDAALRKELLAIADLSWSEHLEAMETLTEVVGWQALAQKDPDVELRLRAFEMFRETAGVIRARAAGKLLPHLLATARRVAGPNEVR